ncbi:MAG: alkaline phosphatase family protein [Nitrososphaerales archaeon]|jgi:hypothetical protein
MRPKHVCLIILENTGYPLPAPAPFLESLISKYAFAANYYSVTEPSLPNYLALTGGSTFNVADDNPPPANVQPAGVKSLGALFDAKRKAWRAYIESMPAPCAQADAYPYAAKHNPWVFYSSITGRSAYCAKHVVDFNALAADIAGRSPLPNFAWITPNMEDDGHDTSITFADTWLNGFLAPLIRDPRIMADTVFFIVADETHLPHSTDNTCPSQKGGQVFCVLVGRPEIVKAGYASKVAYNHYSVLATIEKIFRLGDLGRCDASAATMDDLFVDGP